MSERDPRFTAVPLPGARKTPIPSRETQPSSHALTGAETLIARDLTLHVNSILEVEPSKAPLTDTERRHELELRKHLDEKAVHAAICGCVRCTASVKEIAQVVAFGKVTPRNTTVIPRLVGIYAETAAVSQLSRAINVWERGEK